MAHVVYSGQGPVIMPHHGIGEWKPGEAREIPDELAAQLVRDHPDFAPFVEEMHAVSAAQPADASAGDDAESPARRRRSPGGED